LCLRGNEPPNVTASGFPNIRLLFSRINYGSSLPVLARSGGSANFHFGSI
jgi:hypothetical protein